VKTLWVSVISLSLILSLIGCDTDRYEIKQDELGRTIRLDKRTGEIAVLTGDKLIAVKTPEEEEAERKILSKLIDWGDLQMKFGDIKVNLKTSWRAGSLHYIFSVSTTTEKIKKAKTRHDFLRAYGYKGGELESYNILLLDHNDFKLCEMKIYVTSMIELVNEKGDVWELESKSSGSCSADNYRNAAYWNLTWFAK